MREKTDVIFNGSCPICASEIAAYERYSNARNLPLGFTPLAEADLAGLGLTPDDAARRLHVVKEGRLLSGVDAFVVLWSEMPRFRWLAWLVKQPVLNPIAHFVYERVLAPLLFGMHQRREARAAQF